MSYSSQNSPTALLSNGKYEEILRLLKLAGLSGKETLIGKCVNVEQLYR